MSCAVVTGASRGIGRAIALRLASDGWSVVVGCNTNIASAERVAEAIRAAGGAATAFAADVSVYDQAVALIAFAEKAFGPVSALINNAGITRDGLMLRMSEADFDDVIATNLKGAWNAARCALPGMVRARGGRIVNIASVAGVVGNAGQVNYSAAKAGMIGMTKALAREVASRGIAVNAVAPGLVATDMTDSMPAAARDALLARVPMGRMAQPEEIAALTAYLCSGAAAYITGQAIVIDGGLS